MAITRTRNALVLNPGGAPPTFNVTIPGPCKVVVIFQSEDNGAYSGVTFNGTAMTQVNPPGALTPLSTTSMDAYYIDTALSAGTYALGFSKTGTSAPACDVAILEGAASGQPESTDNASSDGTTSMALSVTSSSGAYLMACSHNGAVGTTTSVAGDCTELEEDTSLGYNATTAEGVGVASGTRTCTFNFSAGANRKVSVLFSFAPAAAAATGATHKLAGRGGGLVGPGGLAGKGGGLVARSMENINGIWRPRLWPVGLDLQGA